MMQALHDWVLPETSSVVVPYAFVCASKGVSLNIATLR
jgi:hypothetical protein